MVKKTKTNNFGNLDIKKSPNAKLSAKMSSNTLLRIKLKIITLVENEESFPKSREIPESLKTLFEVTVKNMM